MMDDDEDYLERQQQLKELLTEETNEGVTYINPTTMRPFPQPKQNKDQLTPHQDLLTMKLDELKENLKLKKNKPVLKNFDFEKEDPIYFGDDQIKGILHLINKGSHSDISEAFTKLSEIIKKDKTNARALYELGMIHQEGKGGFSMDFSEAFRLFKLSADLGYPAAQREVAFMYDTGKGVELDHTRALVYYSFAAKAQDPIASMTLGFKYAKGVGVSQSCTQAASYYKDVGAFGRFFIHFFILIDNWINIVIF